MKKLVYLILALQISMGSPHRRTAASGGFAGPTFNAVAYAFQGSSVTSVNTNSATVNSGNISITNGDLLVSYGQATQGINNSLTLSSSNSASYTSITPTQVAANSYGELGYATSSSTSASANFTTTVSTTQGALANLTLDFTCATCGTPASVTCSQPTSTTPLTCSGLTLSAGAHGILGVFCASASNNARTWTIGTINGVAATAMKTTSGTAGTGALACEYLIASGSYSSASAVITQATTTQAMTGTFIGWPY
jgi:hypothetical protein